MKRYLRRLQLAKETGAPFGAGAFVKGNILIVGEQASNPLKDPEQQPFCSDHGCSGWLNNLLDEANVPEEKLFWINALNNNSTKVDLQLIWDELQSSIVVALGQIAGMLCTRHQIYSIGFPHPQYWKRFKSKQRYPLIDFLREHTASKNIPDQRSELESVINRLRQSNR